MTDRWKLRVTPAEWRLLRGLAAAGAMIGACMAGMAGLAVLGHFPWMDAALGGAFFGTGAVLGWVTWWLLHKEEE